MTLTEQVLNKLAKERGFSSFKEWDKFHGTDSPDCVCRIVECAVELALEVLGAEIAKAIEKDLFGYSAWTSESDKDRAFDAWFEKAGEFHNSEQHKEVNTCKSILGLEGNIWKFASVYYMGKTNALKDLQKHLADLQAKKEAKK